MEGKTITLGGWKGAQVPVTFATGEEATILREAVSTYLRLFATADETSQGVCEQFVAAIDEQLRENPPAQPPEPSLNPPSLDASATGGPSNLFSVVSDGDPAEWTATANASWLTVIDPLEPTSGDGQVLYAVMANSGSARQGTITISGLNLVFTVNQEAAATTTTTTTTSTTTTPAPTTSV